MEAGRPVAMGDSTLDESGRLDPEMVEWTTVEKLREMTEKFAVKEHDYTEEELRILASLNNLVENLVSVNSLVPYDGEVIFLNAHRNATAEMMRVKLERLALYAPQAEIHEFEDTSHSGLFMNEALHPFYRDLSARLLRGLS